MSDSTAWLVAKIFVSSTFRDMFSEREALVKRVFPKLRQELLRYRIHLVDYDLRWGITDDQVSEHGAMRACMRLIDESRPFFLGLIGHRYGTSCSDEIDPQMVASFENGEINLRRKSYTELEILYALRDSVENSDMDMLFMMRDSFQLAEVNPVIHSIIADSDSRNRDQINRLREFISSLSTKSIHLRKYRGTFRGLILPRDETPSSNKFDIDGFKAHGCMIYLPLESLKGVIVDILVPLIKAEKVFADVNGLEDFEIIVFDSLIDQILERFGRKNSCFAMQATTSELTDLFVAGRLGVSAYVSRKSLESDIFEYLHGNECRPMIVIGDEGAGKSTTLSYLYQKCQADSVFQVNAHFAGSGAMPDDLNHVLGILFRMNDHSHSEVSARSARSVRDALAKLDSTKRYLFIIDGIDQLQQPTGNYSLSWLPRVLPVNVRVLISISANSAMGRRLKDAVHGRMDEIILQSIPELELDEKYEMLNRFAIRTGKTLTPAQQKVFCETHQLDLPLLLEIALSEIKLYGHRESIDKQTQFVSQNAIVHVLERLAGDYDQEALNDLLSIIAICRYGISEKELHDVLSSTGRNGERCNELLRALRPWFQWGPHTISYSHELIQNSILDYLRKHDVCLIEKSRMVSAYIENSFSECASHSDCFYRRSAELFWQYSYQKNYDGICKLLERFYCLAGLMNYPDGKRIFINLLHVRGWRHTFIRHLVTGIQAAHEGIYPDIAYMAYVDILDVLESLSALEGESLALSASRDVWRVINRDYNNHDLGFHRAIISRLTYCHTSRALRKAYGDLQEHTKSAEDAVHLHRFIADRCEYLINRRSILGFFHKRGVITEGLRHACAAVDGYEESDDQSSLIRAMFTKAELTSYINALKALRIYQAALAISIKYNGRWNSSHTAEAYYRTANFYFRCRGSVSGDRGADLIQAAHCFREAFDIRAEILPKDSFDTIKCLYNLVILHSETMKEPEVAYKLFIEEQDVFEKAASNPFASDSHGLTAVSYMLLRIGKIDMAERYLNAVQTK